MGMNFQADMTIFEDFIERLIYSKIEAFYFSVRKNREKLWADFKII